MIIRLHVLFSVLGILTLSARADLNQDLRDKLKEFEATRVATQTAVNRMRAYLPTFEWNLKYEQDIPKLSASLDQLHLHIIAWSGATDLALKTMNEITPLLEQKAMVAGTVPADEEALLEEFATVFRAYAATSKDGAKLFGELYQVTLHLRTRAPGKATESALSRMLEGQKSLNEWSDGFIQLVAKLDKELAQVRAGKSAPAALPESATPTPTAPVFKPIKRVELKKVQSAKTRSALE